MVLLQIYTRAHCTPNPSLLTYLQGIFFLLSVRVRFLFSSLTSNRSPNDLSLIWLNKLPKKKNPNTNTTRSPACIRATPRSCSRTPVYEAITLGLRIHGDSGPVALPQARVMRIDAYLIKMHGSTTPATNPAAWFNANPLVAKALAPQNPYQDRLSRKEPQHCAHCVNLKCNLASFFFFFRFLPQTVRLLSSVLLALIE